jgi:hypothetical protein
VHWDQDSLDRVLTELQAERLSRQCNSSFDQTVADFHRCLLLLVGLCEITPSDPQTGSNRAMRVLAILLPTAQELCRRIIERQGNELV